MLVVAIVAGAAWWVRDRWEIGTQLASYGIGRAATYADAAKQIAEIEKSGDPAALRKLVSGWGTGNDRFDYYLARYVVESPSNRAPSNQAPSKQAPSNQAPSNQAPSSEALREAFSRELSWRPPLLPRWAHFWSWQVKQPPAEEIMSVRGYLAALLQADPPRKLSWREVLALQAVFTLTGHTEAAHRLDTTNWRTRLRQGRRSLRIGGQARKTSRTPRLPWL